MRQQQRLRQYPWEGGFFLLALLACIARHRARAARRGARARGTGTASWRWSSHQFKTPLASLQLSLETMSLRHLPPEQARALMERMLADLARMEADGGPDPGELAPRARPHGFQSRAGAAVGAGGAAWWPVPGARRRSQRDAQRRASRPSCRCSPIRWRWTWWCATCWRTPSRPWRRWAAAASPSLPCRWRPRWNWPCATAASAFVPATARGCSRNSRASDAVAAAAYYGTGLGLFIVRRLMQLAQAARQRQQRRAGAGRATLCSHWPAVAEPRAMSPETAATACWWWRMIRIWRRASSRTCARKATRSAAVG